MSPFDRAHMTSYSTLIETMRLSYTFFLDIAGYLSKVADFNPVGGDPGRISRRSLASQNYSPSAIVWFCLCDSVFSRFSRTPTCDRQTDTDRRTQGHSIHRATIASRVNNDDINNQDDI